MHSYILFVLSLICLFSNFIFAAGGNMGGTIQDGSADHPYLIEDFNDFQAFCNDPNYWATEVCTRLDCDIDLDPALPGRQVYKQAPIAGDTDTDYTFDGIAYAGCFDGNNHFIVNLCTDGSHFLGFFGQIKNSAFVSGLGIENSYINGKFDYFGSLAGRNYGNISNCYTNGLVTGYGYSYGDYFGGLIGYNNGSITNCYSTSSVRGANYVGGLVGQCNSSKSIISNCYSTGTVTGSNYVGGIVGSFFGKIVSNCYSTGSVIGNNDYVGGLVGDNSHSDICYSYSCSPVSGTGSYSDYIGGLVGNNSGNINSCFATGSSKGYGRVGGLVGRNYSGNISNSYSTSFVDGDYRVGGIVGSMVVDSYNRIPAVVENCFWDTQTSDQSIGFGYRDNLTTFDGTGKVTFEMQTLSTFTNASWDFIGEDINGSDDTWRMCVYGIDYPKLWWQFAAGDFACEDGVDIIDFAVLADTWGLSIGQTGYNDKCDLADDDIINFTDLAIFTDNWLEGI